MNTETKLILVIGGKVDLVEQYKSSICMSFYSESSYKMHTYFFSTTCIVLEEVEVAASPEVVVLHSFC